MFTGIVAGLRKVVAVRDHAGGRRLTVDLADTAGQVEGGLLEHGESIAIDGVCLTVADIEATRATFDVITESLRLTTLGRRKVGDRVNIERALRPGDRLGGHFMQGHVDGLATLSHRDESATGVTLWFDAPARLIDEMVPKGSIAIDGVSLTLVDVDRSRHRFSVALIPTTLEVTTLGFRGKGDPVNIETDMIGKYVRRHLQQMLGEGGEGITMDKLREAGFA